MRNAFLTAMLITALIFVWKGGARADDSVVAQDAELGRRVYLWTGCANCHGTDARGAWRGPDLTDPMLLRVRSDRNLFDTIERGRPDTMMAYYGDELAADQIWLIVAYLRHEARRRGEIESALAR